MSEASKRPRKSKKKLPANVADLPDKEVAKKLFGKRAAKKLEKLTETASDKSDNA